ncbi:MAG: hypothetical protein ACLTSZ_02665 [Lachnospiraceae bacterium]
MMLDKNRYLVYGIGSGRVRDALKKSISARLPFESAFINLEDSDVTIEMERFLYEVARSYQECFRVYGSKKSFEWQQLSDEDPVLYERTGDIQQDMMRY